MIDLVAIRSRDSTFSTGRVFAEKRNSFGKLFFEL